MYRTVSSFRRMTRARTSVVTSRSQLASAIDVYDPVGQPYFPCERRSDIFHGIFDRAVDVIVQHITHIFSIRPFYFFLSFLFFISSPLSSQSPFFSPPTSPFSPIFSPILFPASLLFDFLFSFIPFIRLQSNAVDFLAIFNSRLITSRWRCLI